jgi:hypothetical protein
MHFPHHSHSHSFAGYDQFNQYEQPPVYLPKQPAHYNRYGGYNMAQAPPSYSQQSHVHQPQQQEVVTGGVSSVLDYDLNIMAKFLAYLSHRLFNRADTDNAYFIQQVKHVLGAVRLPKSSLMLACYYLLQRYEEDTSLFAVSSDEVVYQTTVISLLLSNKANDDHTFTNKSWSDATGIPVMLLNNFEASWLALINWQLHNTNMTRYNDLTTQFNKYTDSVNKHQERMQYQQQQQQMAAMASNDYHHYPREPISPILSERSEFSPRYNGMSYQSPWNYQQMYNSAGFGAYSHQKSYSLNLEQDYCCSKTGLTQKNQYCSCRFCSSAARGFEWSTRLGTAC